MSTASKKARVPVPGPELPSPVLVNGSKPAARTRVNGSETPDVIRVCILERQRCFADGLAKLMESDDKLQFQGQANCMRTATELIGKKNPDVVICDLHLGDESTIDHFSSRRHSGYTFHKIILSASENPITVKRAIDLGVSAYILKSEPWSIVRHAVLEAIAGRRVLSASLLGYFCPLKEEATPLPEGLRKLSTRELQIVFHIANDLRNREIAKRLGLSPKTIEAHKENIKAKLQLRGANSLREFASQWRNATYSANRGGPVALP